MASIVKVEGKSGTSYRIFVTSGRTQDGGQVRHREESGERGKTHRL